MPPVCAHCNVPRQPVERFVPADEQEAALVEALRRDPEDAATRAVYADWLEQRGDARVEYLRQVDDLDGDSPPEQLARLAALDPAWRAAIGTAAIKVRDYDDDQHACSESDCPQRWDRLVPTLSDRARMCRTCLRPVHFCSTNTDDVGHWRAAVDRVVELLEHKAARERVRVPDEANYDRWGRWRS
jgi:uncharacterized protein (TIGR02996 family)